MGALHTYGPNGQVGVTQAVVEESPLTMEVRRRVLEEAADWFASFYNARFEEDHSDSPEAELAAYRMSVEDYLESCFCVEHGAPEPCTRCRPSRVP